MIKTATCSLTQTQLGLAFHLNGWRMTILSWSHAHEAPRGESFKEVVECWLGKIDNDGVVNPSIFPVNDIGILLAMFLSGRTVELQEEFDKHLME